MGQRAVLGAHRPSGPQGVRNAYSLITVPNEASLALHEKLGFALMGIQKEAGYKLGAWHDVAWLRMAIGDFSVAPEPRVPLSAMDPDQVAEVLTAAEDALARLGSVAAVSTLRFGGRRTQKATLQRSVRGKRRELVTVLGRLWLRPRRSRYPLYWLAKDEATEGGERSWIRRWSRHGLCWRAVSATTALSGAGGSGLGAPFRSRCAGSHAHRCRKSVCATRCRRRHGGHGVFVEPARVAHGRPGSGRAGGVSAGVPEFGARTAGRGAAPGGRGRL